MYDLEQETALPIRLAYVGLWCHSDREGRFQWRPRTLKAGILPHDDVDFARVLHALATRGFIVRYACDGESYGYIPSFPKHQAINNREAESELPNPTDPNSQVVSPQTPLPERERNGTERERKGIARETREPHACPTRAPRVKTTAPRFTPPTIQEVRDYCKTESIDIDCQHFLDHYTANGWRMGRTAMKDWKAAVRKWRKNDFSGNGRPRGTSRNAAAVQAVLDHFGDSL
ncbi:MAG TPA: hypothetical protein PLF81_16065 [Candidatus Anammoximicrobium sp.]|nr:hypothetical protein [Candidatus Anammoximicrobium sp.]